MANKFDDHVWQRIRSEMGKLGHGPIKVGVTQSQGSTMTEDGELTLAELAAIHEFGAPGAGIPQRSFLRATLQYDSAVRDKMERLIASLTRKVIDGKLSPKDARAQLGAWAAAQVKKTITSRQTVGPEPQENKQSTIDRKGSSTPLVDTAQLLDSITWVDEGDR